MTGLAPFEPLKGLTGETPRHGAHTATSKIEGMNQVTKTVLESTLCDGVAGGKDGADGGNHIVAFYYVKLYLSFPTNKKSQQRYQQEFGVQKRLEPAPASRFLGVLSSPFFHSFFESGSQRKIYHKSLLARHKSMSSVPRLFWRRLTAAAPPKSCAGRASPDPSSGAGRSASCKRASRACCATGRDLRDRSLYPRPVCKALSIWR